MSEHTKGNIWYRQTFEKPEDLALMQKVNPNYKSLRALTNDGSIVLMSGEMDEGDPKPVAYVLLQAEARRGQKHQAECAERDANAARLRLCWNSHDALVAALDPDTLEAIADEIDCFEHSARAGSLRVLAKQARAALKLARGQ